MLLVLQIEQVDQDLVLVTMMQIIMLVTHPQQLHHKDSQVEEEQLQVLEEIIREAVAEVLQKQEKMDHHLHQHHQVEEEQELQHL